MRPDGRRAPHIMPASAHRYHLLHKRIQQFTQKLQALEQGDPRALHRTRVASRRLRELLPLLELDSDATSKLVRRLRKVTKRLGAIREVDVLAIVIDELHESDRYDRRALDRVAAAVAKDQSASRQRSKTKQLVVELERISAKLEDVEADLRENDASKSRATLKGVRGWRWALDARLAQRAARLRRAIDEAGAVYLPERLHAVRVALKKLRYALEMASETGTTVASADLRVLRHGQDLLGRLHDRQILIERTREAQASLVPADLATWRSLESLVDALEDDCRRLHARYMRNRDKLVAICERLGARGRPSKRAEGTGSAPSRRTAIG
jgi:CHAD domain-containing protein